MEFTKMHGAGNDYIYVNGFENRIDNLESVSIHWSNRHKGIGADGLVIILPSETCDFKMRMFNADGSEAEMCGNASRCVGKYVYDKGLTNKKQIALETLAGRKTLQLTTDKNDLVTSVTVNMGEPILDADKIPTTFSQSPVINCPVRFTEQLQYAVTCVSMGNPHVVVYVDSIADLDLPKIGPVFEHSTYFPQRTNTEFVQLISKDRIKMRVWERGSGETLACGTGACAAVVASVLNGFSERKVTVELLGGELEIEWNETNNQVYLTGNAVTVFEGEIFDDFQVQ